MDSLTFPTLIEFDQLRSHPSFFIAYFPRRARFDPLVPFDFLFSCFCFLGSNKRSSGLLDHALIHHVGPVRDLVLATGALFVPLFFASLPGVSERG